jgi:hypothetical protein
MILKNYSCYGLKRHQLTGLYGGDMQGVSGKVGTQFQASVAKTVLSFLAVSTIKFLKTVCCSFSPPDLNSSELTSCCEAHCVIFPNYATHY